MSKIKAYFKKFKKGDYVGLIWVLPALLLICVFALYPAVSALIHSFTYWPMANESSSALQTTFVGFDNFKRLFSDKIFFKSSLNLIILISTGLVLGNVSSLFLAEMLHKLRNKRLASIFRFLFVLPMLVPGIVNMLIWTEIIFKGTDTGFANMILMKVLKVKTVQGFYYQENMALFSMIITGFPWMSGTSFLIYLAGLNNISTDVYEALDLDGCSSFKRIFYIDIPLIRSQIKYFVMMGIIGGMQSFSMQLVVTSGGPNNATNVPGYYMYQKAFFSGEWGYACAIGFSLFVVTLTLSIINNKFMKTTEEVM